MELGLSARDRRTLTIGLGAIGVLVVTAKGLPALMTWQQEQLSKAATVADDLARARTAARTLPLLRDSLIARRSRVASLDSSLITGATPPAAAADLASRLEDLAADAAIKINSMQLHSDSVAVGVLSEVAVRVTAVGDVYGLLALLRAVEGGETLMTVKELNVTQSDPAAADGKPENLRVDMLVVGMARIAAEKR